MNFVFKKQYCIDISINLIISGDTMILESNNHSVFKLNYHLILVTKYRRKVINDNISKRFKEMFEYIGKKYLIKIVWIYI